MLRAALVAPNERRVLLPLIASAGGKRQTSRDALSCLAEPTMPDALDLLRTRRSVKPAELSEPGPSAAQIDTLLGIASRVPDHGKLAPWRFIVFAGEARLKAGEKIADAFAADHPEAKPEDIAFERNRLARAPLVVGGVSRAGAAGKASGRGAVPRAGRPRHESRQRGVCARLCCELDPRMVRL